MTRPVRVALPAGDVQNIRHDPLEKRLTCTELMDKLGARGTVPATSIRSIFPLWGSTMNERIVASGPALAVLLRKGHFSDPWHGPATVDLVDDLSCTDAAARPIPDGHSIWEIVLHMTAWQREVVRRLGGAEPQDPADGDWPVPPGTDEEAWERARAELGTSLEQLATAVAALAGEDLRELVGSARDRALGSGITRAEMVAGALQHNAYHSGQIALLRKALQGGD